LRGYRPQTAGLVERFNRDTSGHAGQGRTTPPTRLGCLPSVRGVCLSHGLQSYHRDTLFYLVFGFEPRGPEDFFQLPEDATDLLADSDRHRIANRLNEARAAARSSLEVAKARAKAAYGEAHRQPIPYKPGDLVVVFTPRVPPSGTLKLAELYRGPYRVEKLLSSQRTVSLVSLEGGSTRLAHIDNLKRFPEKSLCKPVASDRVAEVDPNLEDRVIRALERKTRIALHHLDPARVRAALSHTITLAPPRALPLELSQELPQPDPLPPAEVAAQLPPRVPRRSSVRARGSPPPSQDDAASSDSEPEVPSQPAVTAAAVDPGADLVGQRFRLGRWFYRVTRVYTDVDSALRVADFRLLRRNRLSGRVQCAYIHEVRDWVSRTPQ
jgi:hypothetical protein